MSWYGIDYSGSRSPVYVFGAYSRFYPKAHPANTGVRDYIAREIWKAKRDNIDSYRAYRKFSTDKSIFNPDYENVRRTEADARDARDRRNIAIATAAMYAGGIGLGLGVRALNKKYQARKAARLAAQQEQLS